MTLRKQYVAATDIIYNLFFLLIGLASCSYPFAGADPLPSGLILVFLLFFVVISLLLA